MTQCPLCRGTAAISPCRHNCWACEPYRCSQNPEHDDRDVECPDCNGTGSVCQYCDAPGCDCTDERAAIEAASTVERGCLDHERSYSDECTESAR